MRLEVMVVVGLIFALALLGDSEDINFEPFKPNSQIGHLTKSMDNLARSLVRPRLLFNFAVGLKRTKYDN